MPWRPQGPEADTWEVMASIRRLGSKRGYVIRRPLGKATNISRLGGEVMRIRRPRSAAPGLRRPGGQWWTPWRPGGQWRTPWRPGGQWRTPWRPGGRVRGLLEAKGDVWGPVLSQIIRTIRIFE